MCLMFKVIYHLNLDLLKVIFYFEMMLNSFWRAPNTRQNQDFIADFSLDFSLFSGMFGTSANN